MSDDKKVSRPWPFGDNARAIEGYLRSIDDARSSMIVDHGHGQRLYPRSSGKGSRHYDAQSRVCSEPSHQKVGSGPCVDAWEDAFRFGEHRNAGYAPPLSLLAIGEKNGRKRVMARRRARPNAMRNGVTANTLKKRAAEIAPHRVRELTAELIGRQRRSHRRLVGHPPVDHFDVATAAIMRMERAWGYQEMSTHIKELSEDGVIGAPFHYNRLVDAMGQEWLTEILLNAYAAARAPFRRVASLYVADGMVLSTAWTDNSRRGSLTPIEEGPVQILAHMIYEHRWGVPTAFRLTWHQRGLGSAEAPQLPYLIRETARIGFERGYVLTDRAYSSEANFLAADRYGFTLLSPLKIAMTAKGRVVKWKPETKSGLGYERALEIVKRCNPDEPSQEFTFLMPFRQLAESWHAAQKNSMIWFVKSRPDRSLLPPLKSSAKKELPETHYVNLPDGEDEREAVIVARQNVGRRVYNEYLCRVIALILRATVRAEFWYGYNVNYLVDRVFEPIAEDDEMGPYRQAA